jgi:hypothetical protein
MREMLVKQHTVSDDQATSSVKKRAKNTQCLSQFLPTWLTGADQFVRASRITPRYRAVTTHSICFYEELHWLWLVDALYSLTREHSSAL